MPVQPDALALQLEALLGKKRADVDHEKRQARTRVRLVRTEAVRVDPEVALATDIEKAAALAVGEQLQKAPGMYRWRDDMISDARAGAAGAAMRWNADGGASRWTLMMIRARGAVIDGIRERSPLTRGEHDNGVAIEDLPEHRQTAVYVEDLVEAGIEPVARGDFTEQLDDDDLVRRLLLRCTEQERAVLVGTIVQGRPLRELAEHYGVTDSYISMLRTRTLAKLRDLATGPARLTLTVGARPHTARHDRVAHRGRADGRPRPEAGPPLAPAERAAAGLR